MNQNEFNSCMSKLINVYSDKAYPPERAQMIWKAVRMLDPQDFGGIINQMICEHQYAPTAQKIIDAASKFKQRNFKQLEDRFHQKCADIDWECYQCRNFGSIVATKILGDNQGTAYVFRCGCPAGNFYNFTYPYWGSAYEKDYMPDFRQDWAVLQARQQEQNVPHQNKSE